MDGYFPECMTPGMADTLQKRVKERMDLLQLNALQTAKTAGLGDSFVRDILRGKTRSPSAANLEKLAVALQTTPNFLMARSNDASAIEVRRVAAPVAGIPIRGKVAANTWRSIDDDSDDDLGDDAEFIPSVSGFPVEWQFGMIVEGNCLNKQAPHGARLVCLDLIKSQVSIQDGDLGIIERRRFNGQMIQRTAKRIRQIRDGWELWPESDDPAHQKPIRLDKPPEGEDIQVIAKVLWILKQP